MIFFFSLNKKKKGKKIPLPCFEKKEKEVTQKKKMKSLVASLRDMIVGVDKKELDKYKKW